MVDQVGLVDTIQSPNRLERPTCDLRRENELLDTGLHPVRQAPYFPLIHCLKSKLLDIVRAALQRFWERKQEATFLVTVNVDYIIQVDV